MAACGDGVTAGEQGDRLTLGLDWDAPGGSGELADQD